MDINTNQIVSISEANQNFSRVARAADRLGTVVIFKNNKPKYKLVDIEQDSEIQMTDDEKIDFVAARILKEYRKAFEELGEMIKFSRDKVLLLHQIISQETGGDPNLRDINLLDSALESAFQTFDGKELYPTKEEKAARIGYSLISNHAFVDGNKRIGMYVLLSFLEVNGIKIRPSDEEVVRVGLATAAGEMKYEDILAWISENK